MDQQLSNARHMIRLFQGKCSLYHEMCAKPQINMNMMTWDNGRDKDNEGQQHNLFLLVRLYWKC